MPNKRDDFTKETIRKAAARVGYRCSYPGCKNATIGPSMENKIKVSTTGVATHICAAAENGPRYDASMTTEERKGVENFIWLCQTHAKLIDTDVKSYPVEMLHKWKTEAEKNAAIALADSNFFDNYYTVNGANLHVMENILSGLIEDGSYDKVAELLSHYRNNLSECYTEMIFRYRIIYDVYCDRLQLNTDLDSYINLPAKQ